MRNDFISLKGKNILITGVSRSLGIGTTLATLLTNAGANVITHGYSSYDSNMNYPDASSEFTYGFIRELKDKGYCIEQLPPSDLSCKGEAQKIVRDAKDFFGQLDGLILNHAYSANASLFEWTEDHIDKHMNVNVRASMLMSQEFAHQIGENGGVITLFTSGQYLGSMVNEIAYATSKEAIRGLSKQLSAAMSGLKIRVNCVNPGPTDTGWAVDETYAELLNKFPFKRWGKPEDVAKLVLFLHSDYAQWITGQTIASEGGFQR
jgi:3-oxoacyl-[acyl-carrier protein] reductase